MNDVHHYIEILGTSLKGIVDSMAKAKLVRIMSFDPSTTFLGYSVSDYNPLTEQLVVVKCGTINGQSLLKQRKDLLATHGKQFTVLMAIEIVAQELMTEFMPDYVVSESPYMHLFPQSYAALTLVVFVLRRAAHRILNKDIYMIAPKESKKAISNNGEASKIDVSQAVINNSNITIKNSNVRERLTEHVFDAIAATYAFVKIYLFNLLVYTPI